MGNLGPLEIGLILAGVVLLFGARKLPDLGSSVGKSIKNFKRGLNDAQDDDAEASRVDPAPTEERTGSRVE